jgi:hypothetical protein
MYRAQITAQKNRVERARGEYRRKRIESFAGTLEACGSKESLSYRAPQVIHIASYHDGRAKVQTRKGVAPEESSQLFCALRAN